MYLANLSQSNFFDFHLPEVLATSHTTIYQLSSSTMTFTAEGAVNAELLESCDLIAEQPENSITGGQRLVMIGEAINLEKALKVQDALATLLHFFCWKVTPRATAIGYVFKASVTRKDNASATTIKTTLDKLSKQYRIELAWLPCPPKLSEGGLMVMDMDSTVIAVECIDEIAKLAGVGEQVSSVTEQAMQGKLDFKESLYNRVACLAGVEESLLEGIRDRLPLMPGITKLIGFMQGHGWKVAIASGGFTYFADYLRLRLGLQYAISNTLQISDGKLTGKVLGDVIDAKAKARTLIDLASNYDVPTKQTIAVGDGANDLVMMDAAALGVAFHAKPIVNEQASVAIRFAGLDTLLDYLD